MVKKKKEKDTADANMTGEGLRRELGQHRESGRARGRPISQAKLSS